MDEPDAGFGILQCRVAVQKAGVRCFGHRVPQESRGEDRIAENRADVVQESGMEIKVAPADGHWEWRLERSSAGQRASGVLWSAEGAQREQQSLVGSAVN